MSEPEKPDEKDSPDEQWLHDFMGGRDDVSRAYRQAARETPPPEIDDAVIRLAQQEDALRRRMGKDARGTGPIQRVFQARRLQIPFALAATVVIAFSTIMALREDHGTQVMVPPARKAEMEATTMAAPEPVAQPRADAAPGDEVAAAADPARSRERDDYGAAAGAAHEEKRVAAASLEAEQSDGPVAAAESLAAEPAPPPPAVAMEDTAAGDQAPASAPAAPAAKAAPPRNPLIEQRRQGGLTAPWQPEASLAKSQPVESLTCPPDVASCSAWRTAQRVLDAVAARDEQRRLRCYNDDCPIGSTIEPAELAEIAPAFTGEVARDRLRGLWKTSVNTYAFGDRYMLQRRVEDDGSLVIFVRRVRYHLIEGGGIEVLENVERDPGVYLRLAVESSRKLRVLDSKGEPRSSLEPGTLPVERWAAVR